MNQRTDACCLSSRPGGVFEVCSVHPAPKVLLLDTFAVSILNRIEHASLSNSKFNLAIAFYTSYGVCIVMVTVRPSLVLRSFL